MHESLDQSDSGLICIRDESILQHKTGRVGLQPQRQPTSLTEVTIEPGRPATVSVGGDRIDPVLRLIHYETIDRG